MRRPAPVRLDVGRCPRCETCIDLVPLLLARDLAIVSALLQELGIEERPSRRVKELLDKLARKSVGLCTALGFYGYGVVAGGEDE